MNNIYSDKSYKAFDYNWFNSNQITILRLLNRKQTKSIARRLFGVKDVFDNNVFILFINPQEIKGYLPNKKTHYKSYINWRFSAYIYQNLKPLWRLIHFWDINIANKLFPSLNVGFDDLENEGPVLTALTRASVGTAIVNTVPDTIPKYYLSGLRDGFEELTPENGQSNQVWDVSLHLKNIDPSNRYSFMSRILMGFNASDLNTVGIENAYIELELQRWWTPPYPPVTGHPSGPDDFSFIISCVPAHSIERPLYGTLDLDNTDAFRSELFNATSQNVVASSLTQFDHFELLKDSLDPIMHKFYLTNEALEFLVRYSFPVFGISTSFDRYVAQASTEWSPAWDEPTWFTNRLRIKFGEVAISVIYDTGSDDYMQIVMLM